MNSLNEHLYALQWGSHAKLLKGALEKLRSADELVDVTLSCEGQKLKAHKVILSACSAYFLDLFRDNPCQHPIIILRGIKYQNILDILTFMYLGEVNVAVENLHSFLQCAKYLQVQGLANNKDFDEAISPKICDDKNSDFKPDIVTPEPVADNDSEILHIKSPSPEPTILDMQVENVTKEEIEIIEDDSNIENINVEATETNENECEIEETSNSNAIEFVDANFVESFDNNSCDTTTVPMLELIDFDWNTATSRKSFPCPHCSKVFSHAGSLRLHLPKHSGGTKCTMCHAVLSRKYELKVHLLKKHKINTFFI